MDLPPGLALRPRTDADFAFLGELYAQSRAAELARVPWPEERKQAFLHDQFCKQHAHYLQHYPAAQWWVVARDGAPVGRLYVAQTPGELRLMDVTLEASCRNQGVGGALLKMLIAHAVRHGLDMTLHVEPFNPAVRLYQRLGFTHVETRGAYHFMRRSGVI